MVSRATYRYQGVNFTPTAVGVEYKFNYDVVKGYSLVLFNINVVGNILVLGNCAGRAVTNIHNNDWFGEVIVSYSDDGTITFKIEGVGALRSATDFIFWGFSYMNPY